MHLLKFLFDNLIKKSKRTKKSKKSKENKESTGNNKNNNKNCNLVQNYQILDNQIPDSLRNLSWCIYPENINYNNFRLNYNKLQNYYPCGIFYPRCTKELSYLIKNIVKNNLHFSLRCGGRAYEPASLSNGFVIDVEKFNCIKIDKKSMTVTVGSGVRLGDLINKLAKKRLIMATGDSSCVGVSGFSLAGGKGYLSRIFGMGCDNIITVKLISWEGKLLKASNDENSDLLYALKGAGHGSYGAVVELKFNIYKDIYCQIATLTWEWNSEGIFRLIKFFQLWIINRPNNITTDLNMTYSNGIASFYIKFFKFYGSKTELDNFPEIIDFINIDLKSTVTYLKGYYTELIPNIVSYNTGSSFIFSKIKSTMVFELIDDQGIRLMINSINDLALQQFQYQINFTQLGGVVESNELSCYFPKTARYVITIINIWDDPVLTDAGKAIPNNLYTNLIQYTSEYCLPNMIDYDLSDYLTSYYGTNQNTLKSIKTKYDPNNVFSWEQSIPLE